MGFFDKIKQGLKKTSDAVNHSLDSVFAAFVKVDDDLLEELEEALILSDVGASTAAKIVAEVEKRAKLRKTTTADELRDLLARAGFALSRSSRFDVIVEFYVARGVYDIFRINEALFAYDEQLLGSV